MHSVDSMDELMDESHERIGTMEWPLRASVAGGFGWVEAVKQPNQKQLPGACCWFFETTTKMRLLLNPPHLPLASFFRLIWKAEVTCISAEGNALLLGEGRCILSDITHHCLKHLSVASSKGPKHLEWMKKKLLALWQQCEHSLS